MLYFIILHIQIDKSFLFIVSVNILFVFQSIDIHYIIFYSFFFSLENFCPLYSPYGALETPRDRFDLLNKIFIHYIFSMCQVFINNSISMGSF